MSIPLRLTYARIVSAPVVLALVLAEGRIDHSYAWAAALFTAAALTDFFDGFLARRWRITSATGAFLDTTADKLLVTAALIGLLAVGRVWSWVVFVIIGRELVVMALRSLAAVEGLVIEASFWGKIKANFQFGAVVLAMLRSPAALGPLLVDEWAMLAAAVVTIASGVDYLQRFWPSLVGDRAA